MANIIQPTVQIDTPLQRWQIIPIDPSLNDASRRIAHRLNCFGSLYYFLKIALRRRRLYDPFHSLLASYVEQEVLHEVIECPRDHFKTTIYSEGASMWWSLPFSDQDEAYMRHLGYGDEFIRWMKWAHNQDHRTLIVSENDENIGKIGARIRWHYESNDFFRGLFPEILPDSSCTWGSNSLMHKRTKKSPDGEGTYDLLSVGMALQSRHYDRVIEDDLVGKKAIESDTVMKSTINYHRLLPGAFDSSAALRDRTNDEIIVGNRWSAKDLNAWIRENEPDFHFVTHSALGGCCDLHPVGDAILPTEWTKKKLEALIPREGLYHYSCFTADTPILMSDWSEKPIQDIKVGDEVVGYIFGTDFKKSYLTKTKVKYVHIENSLVWKVTTSSGRIFYSTPDHKFWNGKNPYSESGSRKPYSRLYKGGKIFSVYTKVNYPQEFIEDIAWLSGVIDSEGSCHQDTTVVISQSREKNPEVCVKIESILNKLGFNWKYQETSGSYQVSGGRSMKINFLQNFFLAKSKRFIDALWWQNGHIAERDGKERVISTEIIGRNIVYNIQTESGNYVAAGYATKNCQYLNNPIPEGVAAFNLNWLRYYEQVTVSETDRRMMIRHEVQQGEVKNNLSPHELAIFMIVDPNHAGNKGRCRHAITVTGVLKKLEQGRDGKKITIQRIYLLDVWAESCNYEKFITKIYELASFWKLSEFWLETVAAQRILKFYLDYRNKIEGRKLRVNELKIDTSANAKAKRIESMNPYFAEGQVWVRRTAHQDFVQEYGQYPNGKTIDILDTFGYGPQVWINRTANRDEVSTFLQRQVQNNPLASVGIAGY